MSNEKKSKTVTRFFSLTGNTLSCETRCSTRNILCRVDLTNGYFSLEHSSMNLLDSVNELRLYLDVCERILKDRESGNERILKDRESGN